MQQDIIFHLAFPVGDIGQTKAFYVEGLGCVPGRESDSALILNLYGHQLVAHVTEEPQTAQKGIYPRHFGVVFSELRDWEALRDRAERHNLKFYQKPKHRFPGKLTEHQTFFLEDPFHNLLEFKYYHHPSAVFGETEETEVGER
ncbi:putative dioxygenase [Geitlerinema sp. FC II]|nr:VOC family protein [Geitlerinema sp. CS-897]PPT10429.1 putative dioxygenase [Geitlerinema sp. FC II]